MRDHILYAALWVFAVLAVLAALPNPPENGSYRVRLKSFLPDLCVAVVIVCALRFVWHAF